MPSYVAASEARQVFTGSNQCYSRQLLALPTEEHSSIQPLRVHSRHH